MSLLKKLLGKDDEAVFVALDQIRSDVTAWTEQFSALNDRVSKFEAEAETARATYFATPSAETFDKLVAAVNKAQQAREIFSANDGVLNVRRTEITETQEVRDLLVRACQIVHKRLSELAGQHDADERTRCAMIDVEYAGCPTAEALRQKAARLEDEIAHLNNPSRLCWGTERILASV